MTQSDKYLRVGTSSLADPNTLYYIKMGLGACNQKMVAIRDHCAVV
jgi:hypothetical protein